MICAYHATFESFRSDCADGSIAAQVLDGFSAHYGYVPSESERHSWQVSLTSLAGELGKGDIGNPDVFLELQMPLSSARCDVLMLGTNEHGKAAAVVIELKQWSHVSPSAVRDTVSVLGRPTTHPSVQVAGYVRYLRHFHGAFSAQGVQIFGCTFLHNMHLRESREVLLSKATFDASPREFPIFSASNPDELTAFVREHIGHGSVTGAANVILHARISPSTKLLDLVDAAIKDNREWQLLDEQIAAFNHVVTAVEESGAGASNRRLIVVRGGPGTGKSILAIQLLAYAARKQWRVAHVTGSKAFQTVLQAKTEYFAAEFLKRVHNTRFKSDLPVKELFATFRDVANLGVTKGECLDLVIGDEGHRLWDFRRNVRTYQPESDVPMIEEMLRATRVTVIFLDDNQGVRANEIGSVEYLEQQAKRIGVSCTVLELNTQFRCNGSSSYIGWVESVLGFGSQRSLAWQAYGGYQFSLCASPREIEEKLRSLGDTGDRCRMVAGFCWRWSEPRPDGSLVNDVADNRFDGWAAPWIEKGDRYARPSQHRYFRWATDDLCFNQIGSIYSVQGFEFDYVGVIFGDDLRIRNGHWEADLKHNKDRQFQDDLRRRASLGQPVDAVNQLRNIYRVLLTRGMKGSLVYFLDQETGEYFKHALRAIGTL